MEDMGTITVDEVLAMVVEVGARATSAEGWVILLGSVMPGDVADLVEVDTNG